MTLQTTYQQAPAVPSLADYRVECVRSLAELAPYMEAWEALGECAVEPNVFYAPWAMLPALEHLAAGKRFELLFLWRQDEQRAAVLDGFIPLLVSGSSVLSPLPVARMFRHRYCFCVAPLVRAGSEQAVMRAFLLWLHAQRKRYPLLMLRDVPSEGALAAALRSALVEGGQRFVEGVHRQRALLALGGDAQGYLEQALSAKQRKEHRRRRTRLAELGCVRTRMLQPGDELDDWLTAFLALEAKGWKGEQQSALGSRAETRGYFEACVRGAHARGLLLMLELSLDGRPLAMLCDFLAPPGAFAFKIAYDEDYARYAPGVLLELEAIGLRHELKARGVDWVDSCAAPDDSTSNRLWMERKRLATFKLSSGALLGDLWIALYPHAKRLRDWLKRRKAVGCLGLLLPSSHDALALLTPALV